MKRKLAGLLCVCVLFSGCGISSSKPLQTESPPTESQQVHLPLPEQGIVLGESGNLRHIPNTAVESMTAPQMHLLGNGLLLSECSGNEMVLKHISLEDGALLNELAVPACFGTKLFPGSGGFGLCDREAGRISLLDEDFHLLCTYHVPQEGEDWYLNSELDTLYVFCYDRGLQVRDLVTSQTDWLVDNAFQMLPKSVGTDYVLFQYTDRSDQKTYTRCLNLAASALEPLPIGGTITSGIRRGETWLLCSSEADGVYTVIEGDSAKCFTWADSAFQLLSSPQHLLMTDPSGRNLTLYDTNGSFLSQCALPQNSNAVLGTDFVWSSCLEGYFFTDFMDSSCRLMFWDISAETEGASLQMSAPEQPQPPQRVLDQSLYERAEELSRRFGVDIRIAEQCSLDYSHYDTYALTDPMFVQSALDILEESLSLYPEGFFRQLCYGTIESIRIELTGSLTTKDGIDTRPDSAGGFAHNGGSYYGIVLDGFLLQPQTLFHEFTHVIDARLKWDAMIREDALFSEEAWLALQPDGFSYAMAYTDIPEETHRFMESGYFITDYSLTYPTEDRAVLMESAMNNFTWDFERSYAIRRKLQYYADCIRDCFDTENWPETTLWEQVLE